MQSPLVNFIDVLRSHDVRISPAETLDAMHAMSVLGYNDREHLRLGLAATLAKTPREKAIFHRCFDRYFSHDLDQPDAEATQNEHDEADESAADDFNPEPSSGDGDPFASDLTEGEDSPALQELLGSQLMDRLRGGEREQLAVDIAQAAQRTGLGDMRLFTQKGLFTRRILDEMGEELLRNAVIEAEQTDSDLLQPLRQYRDALREQVRDHEIGRAHV